MVALKWPISPNRSVLFAANAIFLEIVYANRMGPIFIKRRDTIYKINKKKILYKNKIEFLFISLWIGFFVLQSIYFIFSGNFKWKFSPCI